MNAANLYHCTTARSWDRIVLSIIAVLGVLLFAIGIFALSDVLASPSAFAARSSPIGDPSRAARTRGVAGTFRLTWSHGHHTPSLFKAHASCHVPHRRPRGCRHARLSPG